MKKLLILSPRYPYPVVGGDRQRIYQICKFLSKSYQLTLLSLCESQNEISMALPEDSVFKEVERIFMPRWRSWLNCVATLPSKLPLQVAYYKNGLFCERVAALMPYHDATIAHLIRVGDPIKGLPGLKILEMTDAISLNYERMRDTSYPANDLRSYVFSLESRRLRRYEERIVDYFDHSFLVSHTDRQFLFGSQPARLARVSVCSNGVDLDRMPFQFNPEGRDIVFIGNMCSLQNLDAAEFMAQEVFPLIRARRPDTLLRVVGRIDKRRASRLQRIDGVMVAGEVPDVAAAARGGGVGVCPLRFGAGVQNKVLEYMALGLPTVSTSIGVEGFSARDGHELLVANGAMSIASSVLRLLDNRQEAQAIALAARNYVGKYHSWEAQLAPFIQTIDRLIQTMDPR